MSNLLIFSLWGSFIFCNFLFVSADCPSPEIPSDIYALTKGSNPYITGAVFNIVCRPGYESSTVVHLRCNADGNWRGTWPICSEYETKAKWWMFLLGMVGVVVLVPCILPRLYFTFIDTSPPRKYWSKQKRAKPINHGSDTIRMQPFPSKPLEAKAPSEPHCIHDNMDSGPMPLPPIRRYRGHTETERYAP